MNTTQIGKSAEKLVTKMLIKQGFNIIANNYCKPKYGEIDIIAECKGILYIFEVRYRNIITARGYPEDTFTHSKCRKFNRIIRYFLQNEGRKYQDYIVMRSFVSVVNDGGSTKVKAYIV